MIWEHSWITKPATSNRLLVTLKLPYCSSGTLDESSLYLQSKPSTSQGATTPPGPRPGESACRQAPNREELKRPNTEAISPNSTWPWRHSHLVYYELCISLATEQRLGQ